MRCSDVWCLLLLVQLGCAIPLDKPTGSKPDDTQRALAGGCLLFRDSPALSLLQGAGASVVLPDGSSLWSFSGATLAAGGSVANGLGIRASGDTGRCFPESPADTASLFAPSPLNANFLLAPLDLVRVGDATWSYYQAFLLDASQPFGVRSAGFGIARWDGATSQFKPTANLLWAGDGPSYGSSAMVLGTDVYAYGCKDSSCFVARVPLASIDDVDAYSYATGANRFSSDPEASRPILNDTGSISMKRHASGRILATSVPPLGGTLMVRSALGPAGPFSKEYALADCELGAGDFCVGGVRHSELETDVGAIAISYVAANFAGTSPGDRYWPRLAIVPLPTELP